MSLSYAADSATHTPDRDEFLADVQAGLSASPKTLSCKYFYDEAGSQIFDQICELDEYYLTRTEHQLLAEHGRAMCDWIGPEALLFEPGAGSCVKAAALLKHLQNPVGYVPMDISEEHLLDASRQVQAKFPDVPVLPLVGDYSAEIELSQVAKTKRTVAFYPGSTIGNFTPEEAVAFLSRLARIVGPGGGLLIGFDRKKDAGIIEAAYNDKEGVTEAFHMNLLRRINVELGADFALERFRHHAPFNEAKSRIEMHLISAGPQRVTVGNETFEFAEGESICTEFSYKHTPEALAAIAAKAGFTPHTLWTDDNELFGIMALDVAAS